MEAMSRLYRLSHLKRDAGKLLFAALTMMAAATVGVRTSAQAPEDRALDLVSHEFLWKSRYQYVMGGKVRLLLFWVGKDDVGGGYILQGQGSEDPSLEAVKLVFGSAPEKAPRQINLWGVATEVVQRDRSDGSPRASAFLGFRKRRADEIPERANALRPIEETGPERALGFFGASLNYMDPERAFARRTRFSTERDFDLSELEEVERMVISRITEVEVDDRQLTAEERKICARVPGFLFTLKEMIDEIVLKRAQSIQRCYILRCSPVHDLRDEPFARRSACGLRRAGRRRDDRTSLSRPRPGELSGSEP